MNLPYFLRPSSSPLRHFRTHIIQLYGAPYPKPYQSIHRNELKFGPSHYLSRPYGNQKNKPPSNLPAKNTRMIGARIICRTSLKNN